MDNKYITTEQEQIINQMDSEELWRRQYEALEKYISAAEAKLQATIPDKKARISSNSFHIEQLGYNDKKSESTAKDMRTEHFRAMEGFVSAIASMKKPFNLIFSNKDGVSALEYGVAEDEAPSFYNTVRAYYGRVKCGRQHFDDSKQWRHTYVGSCQIKIEDRQAKAKDETSEINEYFNWISALGKSIQFSDYAVIVTLTPTQPEYLSQRLEELQKIQEHLSMYSHPSMQTNTQSADSVTPGGFMIPFLRPASSGKNIGSSTGISGERDMVRLRFYIDKLEAEAQRLRTALLYCGWQVTLTVLAASDPTAISVMEIISGTLTKSNWCINWNKLKGINTAYELYGHTDIPSFWMNTRELHKLVQLPDEEFIGFSLVENEDFNLQRIGNEDGIHLGNILWNSIDTRQPLFIEPKQLNRHAFICGMTGAGKTNTLFHILRSLNTPFLIIEPVKTEYRTLSIDNQEIDVLSMDSTDKNALRINPFWFPEGGKLQFHMDAIKTIIASAFVLYAAMPNILEQCINNIYVNCGWNVAGGKNLYKGQLPEQFLYPTMDDLYQEIQKYLDDSDYTGETLSTYRGALATRLKSFTTGTKGLLLNTPEHPNYAVWHKRSQVIELDALSDDADKSIVMGTILIQYYQYLKLNGVSTDLKHITVIEEAHRLFKNVKNDNQNAETANPVGQLVETLNNMMAEIRAYGEGIIVADQSPTKIAPDVIKNSNLKVVHRLDSIDDGELIANALGLEKPGAVFSLLEQGEAVVRVEKMLKPSKILVPEEKRYIDSYNRKITEDDNDWKRSPIADAILQNKRIRDRLNTIMSKCVNHVLYDDMQNTNNFITAAIEQISNVLSSYGYSNRVVKLNKNVYVHLMLSGFSDTLRNSPLYGNHYKFIRLLQFFFERILQISWIEPLSSKEMDLLEQFRAVRLHSMLQEIFSFSQERGREYSGVMMVCGADTIYCDFIVDLVKLQENSNAISKDNMHMDAVKEFVMSHMRDYFIIQPSEPVVNNISTYLYMILIMAYTATE